MWQLKSNWSQLTNLETYLHLLNLTLPEIAAIVATIIGAATDLKTRKIYNWLTFPSAFIGIGLNAYLAGLQGFIDGSLGWALATLVMIFPNPGKRMHFGDVKMMAAVGAFLGPIKFLMVMFYFSLLYGIVAIAFMIKAIPPDQYKAFWLAFTSMGAGVDLSATVDMTDVKAAGKRLIPLGPIIAAGTILGILLAKPTMHFMGFNWY